VEQINDILGKLKPFENKTVLVSNYQDSTDIINEILKAHVKYKSEYDKISKYFWKGSTKKTCQYIFNYLKNNIQYIIEPDAKQTVKSPAAIIAQGYGDCKHYSLFTAGILDSLRRSGKNIDFSYRFANYKLFSRTPHHVFCVVNPKTKHEIWIDAVLENFNEKKTYVNAQDKNYKQMALYSISGTNDEIGKRTNYRKFQADRALKFAIRRNWNNPESKHYKTYQRILRMYNKVNNIVSGFDRSVNIQSVAGIGCCCNSGTTSIEGIGRRSKAERKARRKSRREARKSGPNCKGRIGAKIALAIPRKAFLLLVRVNFKKLGQNIYKTLQSAEGSKRLYAKWCGLGGNAALLRSTATKAYNKAKRKGKVSGNESIEGIGFVLSTTIASAAPVVKALMPIIKSLLKKTESEGQDEQTTEQIDGFGAIKL